MQLTMIRPPSSAATGRAQGTSQPATPDLRPILEGDLEAIGHLYARAFPDGTAGTAEEAIADVRASWDGDYGNWLHEASLLAESDGRPVGAILMVDSPPWEDVADLVFMIDLFVDPSHRGRGHAGRLVRSALAAVPTGREVGLRVESDNSAAVRLYERAGFEVAGTGDG